MIHEVDFRRFKKTVQMVTYAPHFISTVVVCSMTLLLLDPSTGVINNVIAMFGGERTDFISRPELFPSIFVWSGVWQNVGWGTIIYLAALAGVSGELTEAARIDGANRFHIIWHISIPTILPTIIITFILRCGSILSVSFEKVFLLQNSLNLEASEVISTYVYNMGLRNNQYSYSAAIGLFNNVINITVLLFVNGIARRLSNISVW